MSSNKRMVQWWHIDATRWYRSIFHVSSGFLRHASWERASWEKFSCFGRPSLRSHTASLLQHPVDWAVTKSAQLQGEGTETQPLDVGLLMSHHRKNMGMGYVLVKPSLEKTVCANNFFLKRRCKDRIPWWLSSCLGKGLYVWSVIPQTLTKLLLCPRHHTMPSKSPFSWEMGHVPKWF